MIRCGYVLKRRTSIECSFLVNQCTKATEYSSSNNNNNDAFDVCTLHSMYSHRCTIHSSVQYSKAQMRAREFKPTSKTQMYCECVYRDISIDVAEYHQHRHTSIRSERETICPIEPQKLEQKRILLYCSISFRLYDVCVCVLEALNYQHNCSDMGKNEQCLRFTCPAVEVMADSKAQTKRECRHVERERT